MRENRTSGSVRGASGNRRSYREMRFFILLSVLLFPICSNAVEIPNYFDACDSHPSTGQTIFRLSMSRSFHPNVTFHLCERKNSEQSFLRFQITQRDGQIDDARKIKLDSETYTRLLKLYYEAVEYNVRDDATGADGSSWCLETSRMFTYALACFWTPTPDVRAEERGLIGLYNLGRELWELAELESEIGRLY